MKSKRTVGLPINWHPVAFPFKDGGGLGEHPLICHHQRMFGSRENGKENEKSEAEERRSQAGELEASPVTLLIEVD